MGKSERYSLLPELSKRWLFYYILGIQLFYPNMLKKSNRFYGIYIGNSHIRYVADHIHNTYMYMYMSCIVNHGLSIL